MLSFGLLDVFFSMLYFFLFFVWIMLLFRIFADIFRDKDASGFSGIHSAVIVSRHVPASAPGGPS